MASLRNATAGRIVPPPSPTVALSATESQICTLLDECTQHLKKEHGLVTSCRIAGGWVRDKLLGEDSNDIDVALEDMMGLTFAEYFVAFVAAQKDVPVGRVTAVGRNPEQSKHLETAKTAVLGLELDFVNLRSETYAEDNRIPTEVAFGTPLDDARRRDSTINALFYNVHTRAVEDHTGKGLDDLQQGVIRTPLPPRETFQDDPLRVIRCIRFASRFGFDLVPELRDAAREPAIQQRVATGITRERVGEEIHKMMKGRDPLRSVQLIHELALHSAIFSVPPSITATFSTDPAPFATSLAAVTVLQTLLHPQSALPALHPALTNISSADQARLFLAAALTHYRGVTYTDAKKKSHPAIEAAIRDGVKLGTQNHYLDGIPALFAAADLIKNPRLDDGRFAAPSERVAIGLLLREKVVHNPNTGSLWSTSVLFSLLQELAPLYDPAQDHLDVENAAKIVETYNAFLTRVVDLDLPSTVDAKPIVDGRTVVAALGASRPGQWTGQVLARVVEWQLAHPKGTQEECVAWLKAEQAAGRVQVDDAPPATAKRPKPADGAASKKAKR
ncbi:hypothetical protein PLICRDRAFT_172076 [Plicaturopsis crispa FD-325 SS-3]|nr:hypothetical protein PLICRDRAFT_172076 [Plicaturopsis crispa FD-325 SS-3]